MKWLAMILIINWVWTLPLGGLLIPKLGLTKGILQFLAGAGFGVCGFVITNTILNKLKWFKKKKAMWFSMGRY